MDWLRNLLDPIQAGTWPDWVAAVFTSLAFLVAAFAFAHGVEDRRKQQARLVHPFSLDLTGSPWLGGTTALTVYEVGARVARAASRPGYLEADWVEKGAQINPGSVMQPSYEWLVVKRVFECDAYVHNASDEVITDVRLGLLMAGKPCVEEASLGYARPHEERIHRHWGVVPGTVGEVSGRDVKPYVVFTDAGDHRWLRVLDHPVQRVVWWRVRIPKRRA